MNEGLNCGFQFLRSDELARISRAPTRHRVLSPEMLKQLKAIHRDAAHYLWPTLEHWEAGFTGDMHPEREIAVWRQIADAFLLYCRRHTDGQPLATKKAEPVVQTLLQISTGVGLASDARDLVMVTEEVAHHLVACWKTLFGSDFTPMTFVAMR